ncbi:MAG: electron transfer flavoprotein subunit alpha/FixB family protein [Ilumatobacter sp.]|nr:electron transfer flavoprotein subunit alpha/FixB family protein [Ilumatobacter sp.]
MIAVIPVRDGVLPAGSDEAIAECAGRALVVGSGTATTDLVGRVDDVVLVELGPVAFGRWAAALVADVAELTDADVIVCPNSPDGRDLAPRLAAALGRPLLAGATRITAAAVQLARAGGRELHEVAPDGPFVATLQPGVRDSESFPPTPVTRTVESRGDTDTGDATVVEVLPPDVRTMDLAEAARIVGGGAGLDSEQRFEQLDAFAAGIGATMGATRVVTDRAWVHHDKQIGTTGVVVDPDLYLAFGISGAVQHTAGLGDPDHVISVNLDPHCPMMTMADLAIVSDANETLDELVHLLGETDFDGVADA